MKKATQLTVLLLISIHAVGCSSWRLVHKTEYQHLNKERPSIHVMLVDGTRYETQNYVFLVDTLIIRTSKTPFYKGREVAIPSEKIASIKRLGIDHENVALLSIGTVALVYLLIRAGSGFNVVP